MREKFLRRLGISRTVNRRQHNLGIVEHATLFRLWPLYECDLAQKHGLTSTM